MNQTAPNDLDFDRHHLSIRATGQDYGEQCRRAHLAAQNGDANGTIQALDAMRTLPHPAPRLEPAGTPRAHQRHP